MYFFNGLPGGKTFKKIQRISSDKRDEFDIVFHNKICRFGGDGTADQCGDFHSFKNMDQFLGGVRVKGGVSFVENRPVFDPGS